MSTDEFNPPPQLKRERSLGWMQEDTDIFEEAMKKSLVHDLVEDNRGSANQVVPWFLQQMPMDYFNQVSKKIWYGHLRALNALFEMKESPDLILTSPCENWITFIKSHNYAGLMDEMITELPHNKSPNLVRMFTSKDCVLAVNVFGYGEQQLATMQDIESRYLDSMMAHFDTFTEEESPELFTKEAMVEFMQNCPKSYLNLCTPQRFIRQRKQYGRVLGSELVDVVVERNYQWHSRRDNDQKYVLLSIATHNHAAKITLENFASYMSSAQMDIEFLYFDRISDPNQAGDVDMMSVLLKDVPGMTDQDWEEVRIDLERIKWVDLPALQAFQHAREQKEPMKLQQAEILCALCHMLHGKLNSGKWSISLDQMLQTSYQAYPDISVAITELFERRFDPENTMPLEEQANRVKEITAKIEVVVDEKMRAQYEEMLRVVSEARKTNLYVPDRKGLAISVNPENLMTSQHHGGVPYGVFFMHGRRANMFHVRFREHARGGMRMATPTSAEGYTLRSCNHYNECYGLASTQQAKNKDIAEGGSKAVCLVKFDFSPSSAKSGRSTVEAKKKRQANDNNLQAEDRNRLIFRSVRMSADSILDLIVPDEKIQEHIVSYGPRKEYIYLGPDEQITPDHINWITDRAKERQLPYATAFMSSKPKTGINHKQYGVTTEGVCIFLDVALRNMGIEPEKEPFTLKMTGGTSGDVAGNAIKILHRDYGDNAKILGIVDHKACVEDPKGINLEELLRLVHNDLSLESFDPSKLTADGALHLRETTQGQAMCDSMHNRLIADAFLPAGGLPNTIRMDNWQSFLTKDGKPSSPLIVEAANIFIEQEARVKLTDSGVLIVKDSSANKCGVICSAMEIMANLLLTEDEFLEFREEYVTDVLNHLRHLAKMEADVMFQEYKKTLGEGDWGNSLPGIAERISRVMNMSSDYISEQLPKVVEMKEITDLAANALLPSLRRRAKNQIHRLPEGYIINMVAKYLSSQMVYHEGLDYVERSIPRKKFAQVALQYFEETKRINEILDVVRDASLDSVDKEEILELLRIGGPRVAVSNSKIFAPSGKNQNSSD